MRATRFDPYLSVGITTDDPRFQPVMEALDACDVAFLANDWPAFQKAAETVHRASKEGRLRIRIGNRVSAHEADVPAHLGQLEKYKAVLWARLLQQPPGQMPAAANEPDRYLTVEEAAAMFKVSKKWLYAHKRNLPHS